LLRRTNPQLAHRISHPIDAFGSLRPSAALGSRCSSRPAFTQTDVSFALISDSEAVADVSVDWAIATVLRYRSSRGIWIGVIHLEAEPKQLISHQLSSTVGSSSLDAS